MSLLWRDSIGAFLSVCLLHRCWHIIISSLFFSLRVQNTCEQCDATKKKKRRGAGLNFSHTMSLHQKLRRNSKEHVIFTPQKRNWITKTKPSICLVWNKLKNGCLTLYNYALKAQYLSRGIANAIHSDHFRTLRATSCVCGVFCCTACTSQWGSYSRFGSRLHSCSQWPWPLKRMLAHLTAYQMWAVTLTAFVLSSVLYLLNVILSSAKRKISHSDVFYSWHFCQFGKDCFAPPTENSFPILQTFSLRCNVLFRR